MSTGTKTVGRDLTQGSIMKSLLIFAFPIVLMNLVQQLYSMVDLMVIGRFVGNNGTVGVSVGGEVVDFLTPVATAFATAGQIYIAQLAGAKQEQKLKRAIGTFISMMLIISTVLMVILLIFHKPILELLNCAESAFSQATAYMVITAFGLPFIFGYNAVCGLLRGMGESKRPLIFIIIAATVNIFLDILLVAVLDLQAAGTAIATVASQIASFAATFVYMYKHRDAFEFELKLSYFRCEKEHLKVILKIGLPQAARSILVHFSMLWVNANVNACGDIASGTNGIGNKLQKFLEIFSTSVAQACAAMVGQNLGAKKYDRAKKVVHCTLLCCLGFAAIVSAVILIFPHQVFGIFTTNEEVIALGKVYLQILVIHVFVSAVTGSYQSMVIGAGNASLNFVLGILDGVVCKIGASLLFVHVIFGVTPETDWYMTSLGYFWGVAISRVLPAIVCMIYFYGGYWKRRKLLSED
ncbi:MAG: MATE family efflux transporter [Oscillospiraceae bacterium]